MAKAIPHVEREEQKSRLREFLDWAERGHLKINRSRLADKLGLDRSALSNAVSKKSARGVSANVQGLLEDRVGLQRLYWTSPTRLAPEQCMRPVTSQRPAAEDDTAISLRKVLGIAGRRGEPSGVIVALTKLEPPAGKEADGWWWIEEYFKLSEAAPSPKKARRAS